MSKTSGRSNSRGIAIGRGKEEADPLALGEGDALELDRLGAPCGPGTGVGVSIRTASWKAPRNQGRIGDDGPALVGLPGQLVEGPREGLGKAVGSRDQEIDDDMDELLVVEGAVFDWARQQIGRDAGGPVGILPDVLDELADPLVEIGRCLGGLLRLAPMTGPAMEEGIDARSELVCALEGKAGEATGHMTGDAGAEILGDVETTFRQGLGDQPSCELADLVLPFRRRSRAEMGAQDRPHARVPRRIHLARHQGVRFDTQQQLGGRDAAGDRELAALGRRPDIVEAREEPGVEGFLVVDRMLFSQPGVLAVGIVEKGL